MPAYEYTAVIPYYLGENFILRSVTSVVAQTLRAKEVVVVFDDGGAQADRTMALLSQNFEDTNFRFLVTPSLGQSAARNFGARASNSDAILFLDQDDAWHAHHAETSLSELQNCNDFVYSDVDRMFFLGPKQFMVKRYSAKVSLHPKESIRSLFGENFHILPSVMGFRKNAFEELGGFNEALRGFEDDDLFHRALISKLRIRYIPVSGAIWYETPGSSSISQSMVASRQEYLKLALRRANQLHPSIAREARVEIFQKFFPHILLDVHECTDAFELLGHQSVAQTFGQKWLMFAGRVYRFSVPKTFASKVASSAKSLVNFFHKLSWFLKAQACHKRS